MKLSRIPKRIFGKLSQYIHAKEEITIITGANAPFYESLRDNLINSIWRYEPNARLIIWDLGLEKHQLAEIQQIITKFRGGVVIRYPENILPEFYSMQRFNYAFKSYCIFHSLPMIKTKYAMWLDAGCGIRGKLQAERNIISLYGYYSPYSGTTVGQLTYNSVLDNFLDWKTKYSAKEMLSGGVQGWDMNNNEAIALLSEWYNLGRMEDNIAPKGANLHNHRYDQSLLSLVYYSRYKQVPYMGRYLYNIRIQLKK